LPKITIAWWNTVTNKFQQAVLPQQTITVKENPNAPQTSAGNINPVSQGDINTPLNNSQTTAPTVEPIIIEKVSYLQWVFLALWLFTAIAWILHVNILKRSVKARPNSNGTASVNNHYLALMAACKKNNAEQALSLIVPWSNSLLSADIAENVTLSATVELINDSAFTCEINVVQQHLYGKDSAKASWLGSNLLKIIQRINTAGLETNKNSTFTLNPS